MSDRSVDMRDGISIGAQELLARAAAADVRARNMLTIAVEDFFLPEEARLDERARAALADLLRAIVRTIQGELSEHAARLLTGQGEAALAAALARSVDDSVLPRIARAGLLRDPELMGELMGRVGQELLGNGLPMQAGDHDQPSLINRLAQNADRVVAAGAMAVLISESRRRSGQETGLAQSDLPAELHHRLLWWVAAALRERMAGREGLDALDRALVEAAQRSLAAYDEADRLEAAVIRLAVAIDAEPDELGALLVEVLGDRRIVLFIALLAHALGVEYAIARDIVLDSAGDRLWLALRALEQPRDVIAQIGYALCEADIRRDLEIFADTLDAVVEISGADARLALASLRLDPAYRAALMALEQVP